MLHLVYDNTSVTKMGGWVTESFIHSLSSSPTIGTTGQTIYDLEQRPFIYKEDPYSSTKWPAVLHMLRTGRTMQYKLSFRLRHHKTFKRCDVWRCGVVGGPAYGCRALSLSERSPFPATPSLR